VKEQENVVEAKKKFDAMLMGPQNVIVMVRCAQNSASCTRLFLDTVDQGFGTFHFVEAFTLHIETLRHRMLFYLDNFSNSATVYDIDTLGTILGTPYLILDFELNNP
jgi:hypothetical protein